jgi:hypothetical protein
MRLIALLILLSAGGAAMAQRPNTLAMSCAEARGLVNAYGAVVMTTGVHTFERFVASPGFCELGMYGQRASAPTRDTPQCPVGYVCYYRPAPWEDGLFD